MSERIEDLEASTQIGQVLAGKYRVDRVLGAGGMGIVVAAMHLQLDQMVALKFIRREALGNAEVVSRFEREARAAVRLKSEHAARIIDVGRLDSGSPYIVMEYLEGQDLSSLLHQQRSLPVAVACDFVIQACDAISEAHSLGIVHRDLKPGNLFLANTSHGQQAVKVLDFGISKSQGLGDASMTRTQAVMGSPGYMSPEQMRSTKLVDGRSDVWSLGVILYELVAGRPPFDAETFTALCVKIAMDPHPPLPAFPIVLPAGFETVINRALEKDPVRRYQSAVELAQALAPFANAPARERALRLGTASGGAVPGWPAGAGAVGMGHAVPTTLGGAAQSTGPRTGSSSPGKRRSIGAVIAAVGLGAAVMIGGAIALVKSSESSQESQTTIESSAPPPAAAPPTTSTTPASTPSTPSTMPATAPVVATPPPAPPAPAPPTPPPPQIVDAGVPTVDAPPPDAATDRARDRQRDRDKPRGKTVVNPYESPD